MLWADNPERQPFPLPAPFMTTFAIGDLQGCQTQLAVLLDRIFEHTPDAELIFLGDIVNRGPRSLDTLRQVRALGERARIVLGNHDLHLLAVANGIRRAHRSDTIEEILQAPDRAELLDWLRCQPLALARPGQLLVHAGVLPTWTAARAMELAHEVETVLRGGQWLAFMQQMYGDTPSRWDDTLQGVERWRCIVNALTRLRYCCADGSMVLGKEENGQPEGAQCLPWYDVPGRLTEEVTVVFGHWSVRGLVQRDNLLGLDTGCVWGGKLTAVNLDDRSLLQVDCPQHQRPG